MKRITIPLTVSVLLLLVYGAIQLLEPPLLGPSVAKYVRAILLLILSVGVIRAISFVLFDIVFQKRKGVRPGAFTSAAVSNPLLGLSRSDLQAGAAGTGQRPRIDRDVHRVLIDHRSRASRYPWNFFAGLSIHIEQPFHVLDAIRIGDMIGRVEALTWRTTTSGQQQHDLIFPNSRVARDSLEVYRFNNLNRRVLHIPAPYHVAPQKVIPLIRRPLRLSPT